MNLWYVSELKYVVQFFKNSVNLQTCVQLSNFAIFLFKIFSFEMQIYSGKERERKSVYPVVHSAIGGEGRC